jgi:hypothetical protein
MKSIKLYIPVLLSKKYTLLAVDNIKIIKDCVPTDEVILEHLLIARQKVKQGEEYRTIKLVVPENDYFEMLKEITRKTGKKFRNNCINLSTDLKTLPIIQILKNS